MTLIASTEPWEAIEALSPPQPARRKRSAAGACSRSPVRCPTVLQRELVLAADQFVITPAGRVEEAARARAAGEDVRTVIAGYHWFTDWGRDTMISLEGLTLSTHRYREAGYILRTFGHYVRDGLIPNMFPDGAREGPVSHGRRDVVVFPRVRAIRARHRRPRDVAAPAADVRRHRHGDTSRARDSVSASTRRTDCCGKGQRDIS